MVGAGRGLCAVMGCVVMGTGWWLWVHRQGTRSSHEWCWGGGGGSSRDAALAHRGQA